MSFNNATNSWGGPSHLDDKFTNVNVASNFPVSYGYDAISTSVPKAQVSKSLYQPSKYLLLGDLTADKAPLWGARGGYSGGTPPTKVPALKTYLAQVSSLYQPPSLSY